LGQSRGTRPGWPSNGPPRRDLSPWLDRVALRLLVASAKSVLLAPIWEVPAVANAVTDSQSILVQHPVMPGIKCVRTTGEGPRRLLPPGRVTASYKQAVKGWPREIVAPPLPRASAQPYLTGLARRLTGPALGDVSRARVVPPHGMKSKTALGPSISPSS
jgi:hypothetical protein